MATFFEFATDDYLNLDTLTRVEPFQGKWVKLHFLDGSSHTLVNEEQIALLRAYLSGIALKPGRQGQRALPVKIPAAAIMAKDAVFVPVNGVWGFYTVDSTRREGDSIVVWLWAMEDGQQVRTHQYFLVNDEVTILPISRIESEGNNANETASL